MIAGLDWIGTPPPDWFWGGPAELPDGVRYKPAVSAISTVYALMGRDKDLMAPLFKWTEERGLSIPWPGQFLKKPEANS